MRYGIIDIGSNTIRLIVCEIKNNEVNTILNEKELSVILNFVKDGELLQEGADRLYEVLNRYSKLCRLLNCTDVLCFATASMRKIKNTDDVIKNIREIIPSMEIISGEEEAYYDFLGLSQSTKENSGIGLDLGGGSIQIFNFDDGKIIKSVSLPLGGLEMKNKFIKMVYPTLDEIKNIKEYVEEEINKCGIFDDVEYDTVHLMGGTARACVKIHRYINDSNKKINKYEMSIQDMNDMTERFMDPRVSDINILENIVPDRMNNIIPSIVVLNTVCSLSKADNIVVLKKGVRDGYIYDKIIKNIENE